MPGAVKAIKSAPGVLAVEVDYNAETGTCIVMIGTEKGKPVDRKKILETLKKKSRYYGKFVVE